MSDILDDLIAAIDRGDDLSLKACHCGGRFEEVQLLHTVPIGGEGDSFDVEVPAMRCSKCEETFTDHRAAAIEHAAACRHLGILTPEEVRQVRATLNMSRKAFGEAFAIPPASMERWENGRLLQNKSMDTLLRALTLPGVARALDRTRAAVTRVSMSSNVIPFPNLAKKSQTYLDDVRERSRSFNLQMRA